MFEEKVAECIRVCPHLIGEGRCKFQGSDDKMSVSGFLL